MFFCRYGSYKSERKAVSTTETLNGGENDVRAKDQCKMSIESTVRQQTYSLQQPPPSHVTTCRRCSLIDLAEEHEAGVSKRIKAENNNSMHDVQNRVGFSRYSAAPQQAPQRPAESPYRRRSCELRTAVDDLARPIVVPAFRFKVVNRRRGRPTS